MLRFASVFIYQSLVGGYLPLCSDVGERSSIDSSEAGVLVLEGEATQWNSEEAVRIASGDDHQTPAGVHAAVGIRVA